MIVYPNAKINLGLRVLSKRPDGYHNIETVMIPVPARDILEVIPAMDGQFRFGSSGTDAGVPAERNLVVRAFRILERFTPVDPVHIHLHKQLPLGAGLGGGSSDAAFLLKAVNSLQALGLDDDALESLALEVGSDVPFFIRNIPVVALGRGEVMDPFPVDLSGYYLVVAMPDFSVSTKEAYAHIQPDPGRDPLSGLLKQPLPLWKSLLCNDFETYVFSKFPESVKIKKALYSSGALYAQMSGSGAAFFGVFEGEPELKGLEECKVVFSQKL
ncbi:MAG: 4-(cytidine 5'-diphospho)-2-C-methyl-D-erythritol kinase [Bacteroidales bacterium]